MTAPDTPRPTPVVQIGNLKFTGPMAFVALVVILAAVVALLIWAKPSIGMLLSGLVWFGFTVFWSVTRLRGVQTKSQESPQSRSLHRRLLNSGLLLLFIPIPGLRRHYLPEGSSVVALGLAVQAAFALLHVWARVHLGRNWSSPVMIKIDHQLVTSGPYRLVRHPIYTAIIGMAAGTAIVSNQLHGLLGLAVFTYAYVRKLKLEEQHLGETFGAEWDTYRKKSWALIPGVM